MDSDLRLEKRSSYRFSILSTLNMRCAAELYTRKFDLSTAGWRILSIIGRYEPIFPGVAAQLSSMDADKVTRAVDRLVEMQLVVRNADVADRRRVILCLSSRGHTVFNEVEGVCQALEADLRSAVSADEWTQFAATLDKLEERGRVIFSKEASSVRFAGRIRGAAKKAAPVKAPTPASPRKAALKKAGSKQDTLKKSNAKKNLGRVAKSSDALTATRAAKSPPPSKARGRS